MAQEDGLNLYKLVNSNKLVEDETFSNILKQLLDDQTIKKYQWNDMGMSELFSKYFRNNTLYCPERKHWYVFNGQKWVKDEGATFVDTKIKQFVELMMLYCTQISTKDSKEEKEKQDYTNFINKFGSRTARERLLKDAQSRMTFSVQGFDANPYLINCKNGTYDLKNDKFHSFDANDYLTFQTNCFYPTPNLDFTVNRWDEFISEIMEGDKDLECYLQKCLGYSLSGNAKEEKMFIFYGQTTRNGKGTLLNTIERLLGDYATNIDVNFICRSKFGRDYSRPNPMVAQLKGTRLVIMNESDDASKLDESLIKNYTGNDPISTRELYGEAFTFFPQFTMFLSANNLPDIYDKAVFSSERVSVIPFNRHFNKEEQDPDLKNKFATEEAKTYIFKWLLEGYRLYIKEGINNPPKAVQDQVSQYEKDNDVVALFMDDKTEEGGDDDKCLRSQLYQVFKGWCHQNGVPNIKSSQKFFKDCERLGYTIKRSGKEGNFYIMNVKIKEVKNGREL